MARDQLIRVRRDTAANWAAGTKNLFPGEIGLETDTGRYKLASGSGDTEVAWGDVPYAPVGIAYTGTGNNVVINRATNIAGGSAGSLPYQTGANATGLLGIGTANKVLAVNSGATAPEWVTPVVSTTYFAATTSAQLAAVLSDATGTGVAVFNNTPTLTTPAIQSGGATFAGSTSGTTTLRASATASGVLTLPATTGTVAVLADFAPYIKEDSVGDAADFDALGLTKIKVTSGTITLPSATGGVTLATTTVTNGFVLANGTVSGGTTLTGNLSLGANGISVTAGVVTFPTAGAAVVKATADSDYVNTGAVTQTVAGAKTFSGTTVISGALTASNATVTLSGITSAGDTLVKINPSGGALSSGKASLTADVSGILPVANGGFGVNPANNSTDLATARGVLRIFVSATAPTSPAVGDLWFW